MSELLWQSFAKKKPKHKPNKPNTKPTTPTTPTTPTDPGVLTQNNCAAINSKGLPANGSTQIVWPGCTTITFYESYTSSAAQAVWNANPTKIIKPKPANPNASGLLVTSLWTGEVEAMIPYAKGSQFMLSNTPSSGASQYILSCIVPEYRYPQQYSMFRSPDLEVTIPGNIYAGLSVTCGQPTSTPKP